MGISIPVYPFAGCESATSKSSITDAAFGSSLDERIHEGVAGDPLCKTWYDRFGIQSMLLDLAKLREQRLPVRISNVLERRLRRKSHYGATILRILLRLTLQNTDLCVLPALARSTRKIYCDGRQR